MTDHYDERLRKADWTVRDITLTECRDIITRLHYARGGSNTAVYCHGLVRCDDPSTVLGCAWWLPPTKLAAIASLPERADGTVDDDYSWQRVLSLSRLAVDPSVPQNACTFLLSRSVKMIRKTGRWDVLITYADDWQGHRGTIYRAAGWEYMGRTKPEATWVSASGQLVARKAGPRTRTNDEMVALGHTMVGRHGKHKFRLVIH